MHARDLAEPYLFVTSDDDDAANAVRALAEQSPSALLVVDHDGQPHATVTAARLKQHFVQVAA
ncbi:hypothetical protein ACFV2X_48320 [Streptomyces sp. NPDC059679]|uniref:hypothetical protein n=1 Tax=Streptomyces sp. NPDC059679 TaxID=3346903 RepID=UPI00368AC4AE